MRSRTTLLATLLWLPPVAGFGQGAETFTPTETIAISMRIPTGAKAANHCVHVNPTFAVLFTNSTASRFGASAVKNIELVTQVVAMATHMR